ncbi:MAG TPA: protein-glutamate O-methyltransferase CheR [Tepidisphaeraceae bacterium]|nr:protein-glutamate O-methyltransferase CheR [Tepidisphaeraceae bacterium]
MPRSATEGHVVFIDRPLLRNGPLDLSPLRQHALGPAPAAPTSELTAQCESFLRWLFKRAGLDSAAYNPQTLARRLPSCLRFLKAGTPAQARQLLESEPELLSPSLGMLLIGVSSFFRDRPIFDALRRHVLPEISQTRGSLRIWSAACSDGQELYSLAMLTAESDLLRRCELVGTDCRPEATYRARLGIYEDAAVRELPLSRRQRFFTRQDDGWHIVEPLRKSVQWRTSDLLTCPEPGHWQLILCRNMAMYLKPTATGKLWQNLERSLSPGGYLITGKAERPIGASRLTSVAPCIYQKEWT